jgi:tRNA threonylcarbamoyladenosine biosynthesis protein TsaE
MLRLIAREVYNFWVTIAIDLPDETATAALAERLAGLAAPGDIIALEGDVGAGKTSFARAFIAAKGAGAEVPSPTFTLVQTYRAETATIWHFDLYRLQSPDEAWELGIEEAFSEGISLIEWPDRLGSLLPPRRLDITLDFADLPQARQALLAVGDTWRDRLSDLCEHV